MRPLRFAVVGSPVGHSKSPAMHEAAFRSLGLPHTYEKLETTEAELANRVDALRHGVFAGLNVTLPHKTHVLKFVDEWDASAHVTGAANTLVRTAQGRIRAYNTDMPAVAEELSRLAGGALKLSGGVGVVIGTGGAARAAMIALASHLGLGRVLVRGRKLGETDHALTYMRDINRMLIPAGGGVGAVSVGGLCAPDVEDARLVAIVQATSCGMRGADPGEIVASAIRWENVPKSAVVLDVVYSPYETPFLACAKQQGLVSDNGFGMLARQGALALTLWLGIPAPFAVMREALACEKSS